MQLLFKFLARFEDFYFSNCTGFIFVPGVDPGFLERGFIMYKGVGVRFADFISFFPKYPMKMKEFDLIETK